VLAAFRRRWAVGNHQLSTISGVVLVLLLLAGCQSASVATPAATLPPTPTPLLGVDFVTRVMPTTAVIQTTPTPLPPTAIPPTATPIAYAVQEGDTLLGIAIDHQTTTEEITALNPDVDARLLSIGQIIILPQPAAVAIAVAGTPIPIQADIENVVTYHTPLGGMWVMGEVKNDGDAPIANVQVEVALLTPSGEVGAMQTAWVATAVISPNQTAPFAMLFPQQIDAQPVVSIVGGESVGDLGDRYLALTAVDTTLEIVEDGVLINGRLRNNGTLSTTQISLTTTFYDADDAITGYDYRILGDEMLPEGVFLFSFIAAPPGGNTTAFTITAQGKIK